MPDARPEDPNLEQSSQAGKNLDATGPDQTPRASIGAAAPPWPFAPFGALLLLIGFFLPWYSINLRAEVDRALPGFPSHFLSDAPTLSVSGGHIQHGLGWVVLLLGLAAAALACLAGDVQTWRRAGLACLGAGTVILVYVMTRNLRHVSMGLFLTLVGYGMQWNGALQSARCNARRRRKSTTFIP